MTTHRSLATGAEVILGARGIPVGGVAEGGDAIVEAFATHGHPFVHSGARAGESVRRRPLNPFRSSAPRGILTVTVQSPRTAPFSRERSIGVVEGDVGNM